MTFRRRQSMAGAGRRSFAILSATALVVIGGCPTDAVLDGTGLSTDYVLLATESEDEPLGATDDGPLADQDALSDLRFAVDQTGGPASLTLRAYAFTVSGDPLPEGMYEWSFDDGIDAGPMSTHAEIWHTLRSGGVHTVRLSLTLAALTIPIGCAHGRGGSADEAEVTVWPTIAGHAYDAGGNPREGVLIYVEDTDLSATTDGGGRYALSVPYGASGVLRASLSGHKITPPAWSFSNIEGDLDNIDFGVAETTVATSNSPPRAISQSAQADEDVALTVTLVGEDDDDDPLTYIILTLPEYGSLRDEGGGHAITAGGLPYALGGGGNLVTYHPDDDYEGADGFAFRVDDGTDGSEADGAGVSLSVAAINDPPSFTLPADQCVNVDTPCVVDLSPLNPGPANEGDQAVTLSAHSSDQAIIPDANLVFVGNQLSITAAAASGSALITVVARDDGGTGNGGEDSSSGSFVATVVAGPMIFGTVSRVETVGADPPIGPVALMFAGSGAWSGTNFNVLTDASGGYAVEVVEGWTGTVAAADPDEVFLTPPVREYVEPVTAPKAGQDFAAWIPPIGIPAPTFGIEETHYRYADAVYDFGNGPEPYPDFGDGPYTHYVDNTHPNATDLNNPYGIPGVPRLTIPVALAPGSVVEVRGGPYAGVYTFAMDAFADSPVFVRGSTISSKPRLTGTVTITGSYVVFEGFDFDMSGSDASAVTIRPPAHHVAVRHSEARDAADANFGVFFAAQYRGHSPPNTELLHDVVFYNNHIHDNGDLSSANDTLGILISQGGYNLWMVDNHIHHNGGDSIHVNAYHIEVGQVPSHHVYIGRNHMHDDEENALDMKWCHDVIISQNLAHDYTHTSPDTTFATAMLVHRGDHFVPEDHSENIWFLHNTIHHSHEGLKAATDADQVYFVGNVIHDIDAPTVEADGNGWAKNAWQPGAGICVWTLGQVYIHNNTISRSDAGIRLVQPPNAVMTNNIIADLIDDPLIDDYHIQLDSWSAGQSATMQHNVLYQQAAPVAIGWGGARYAGIDAFQSATDKGVGCIEDDPRFVDGPTGDFHLQAGSPAIDAATATDYVERFLELYGIDISVDADGAARPPTPSEWDAGAYEWH